MDTVDSFCKNLFNIRVCSARPIYEEYSNPADDQKRSAVVESLLSADAYDDVTQVSALIMSMM